MSLDLHVRTPSGDTTRRTEECCVKTQAETGEMQPQAMERWSHQKLEEPGLFSLRAVGVGVTLLTSILTSGLQDCEKIHIFVFFYFKRCWFGGLNFFSELIEITLLSLPIHAR